jgi:hypothetical protein
VSYKVLNANGLTLGNVVPSLAAGWRFIPATCTPKPSPKAWPTPEAALPQWVAKQPYILEPNEPRGRE